MTGHAKITAKPKYGGHRAGCECGWVCEHEYVEPSGADWSHAQHVIEMLDGAT